MKKNVTNKKSPETAVTKPTLEQLQRELALKFASLGVLFNDMFRANSGNRMLGLPDNEPLAGAFSRIDVFTSIIGSQLQVYHSYAYDGRILSGHERTVNPFGNNEAEKLRDFIELFGHTTGYTEVVQEDVDYDGEVKTGGLEDLMNRMIARNSLDAEHSLSIQHLALLADLNERTVKNATIPTTTKKAQLPLNNAGEVEYSDAIIWLMARAGRGFTPTQVTSFPVQGKESDVQLDTVEIPAFVKQRIIDRFAKSGLDTLVLDVAAMPAYSDTYTDYPEVLILASEAAGLKPQEVQQAMQYPLAISPHQCIGLAKAIGVDPNWFTLQVMQALYPKEMDMVLNPQHYHSLPVVFKDPLGAIEITLTETMIKHGYIDIPAIAKPMFPADCFGTREKDAVGSLITIHYGMGQTADTDMRVKSEKTISPRKRFTGWLQTEISAKAGDRIRIERIGQRDYQLKFQPVGANTAADI